MARSISMYVNDGTSRIDNITPVTLNIPRMMTPPLEDINKDGILDIIGLHNDQSRITILVSGRAVPPIEVYGRDETTRPSAVIRCIFDINQMDMKFNFSRAQLKRRICSKHPIQRQDWIMQSNLPNTQKSHLVGTNAFTTPDSVTFGDTPSIYWVDDNQLIKDKSSLQRICRTKHNMICPFNNRSSFKFAQQTKSENVLFSNPYNNIIQWQNAKPCLLTNSFPVTERVSRRTVHLDTGTMIFGLHLAKTCTYCDSNHWLYVVSNRIVN